MVDKWASTLRYNQEAFHHSPSYTKRGTSPDPVDFIDFIDFSVIFYRCAVLESHYSESQVNERVDMRYRNIKNFKFHSYNSSRVSFLEFKVLSHKKNPIYKRLDAEQVTARLNMNLEDEAYLTSSIFREHPYLRTKIWNSISFVAVWIVLLKVQVANFKHV